MNKITCPNCNTEFEIEKALGAQIEEDIKKKYYAALAKERDALKQQEVQLSRQQLNLTAQQADFEKKVAEKAGQEAEKQLKDAREAMKTEFEGVINSLKLERQEALEKAKGLQLAQLEIEKLKRENNDKEVAIKLRLEQQFTQQLNQEREKIKEQELSGVQLLLKERDMKLEQLNKELDSLKKKAEQGSMQLQGEAQEIFLEEQLQDWFRRDIIETVGKGQRGADIILNVYNDIGQECGKIYIESKRTKHFSEEWLDKLIADAAFIRPDALVLVSEALPKDIDKIGLRGNVWVCGLPYLRGVITLLRDNVMNLYRERSRMENTSDKVTLLYNYLTSKEFRNQMEIVLKGYADLEDSYENERAALERIWKKREKQLDSIKGSFNGFLNTIAAIGGDRIPNLEELGGPSLAELAEGDE